MSQRQSPPEKKNKNPIVILNSQRTDPVYICDALSLNET